MSDFTFKQIDKNEYETFMEGNSLNIFFKIPDGCKIEDYNIKRTVETPTLVGSPSKAAYFEFTKAPDKETTNFISPLAGLNFLNKSYIKIEEFLSLGDNKEVNIDLKDGASPCFQGFDFANNRDSTFIFTPSSFKKISEEELNKVAFYSSGISTIEGNANLTLTLGDNTLIEDIFCCGSSSRSGLENKVDLSKIRYLDCNSSYFYPKTNGFTIAVECDIFKFIKATYDLSGSGYQDNITLTLDSDIVNAGGTKYELSCPTKITCEDKTIKENKESSILYIDGRTKIIGQGSAAFLTATSKNFNIIRNSTTTIEGFNFINVGEGTINFSDTNVFSNSIASTYDKTANLNLSGARLSGSAIHFTQNDDHVYKIKTLIANNSNIDNAAGTFNGTIENAKVDYLTFSPGSSLYLNMRDRDYKDTHYKVKNLTLEEDAKFLIVPTYGFNDNEKEPITDKICSLENVVAQGDSEITGYVHFDMFNSVVSNFRGSFSRESYRTNLSNSMFSGECDISGVKSIDTSSVENSSIRGNNAEIRNEMIKNLTNYSGAQRESNENAGLANTKELDLL